MYDGGRAFNNEIVKFFDIHALGSDSSKTPPPTKLVDFPEPQGLQILIAGPEGGFDVDEIAALVSADALGVRLGARVLRTETAALAALAAMQMVWGIFRDVRFSALSPASPAFKRCGQTLCAYIEEEFRDTKNVVLGAGLALSRSHGQQRLQALLPRCGGNSKALGQAGMC